MQLPHRFGRYTLLRKLANGGMAEVYLARYRGEEGFTKLVAIKRILPNTPAGSQHTNMLIDEAKALVHVQHQNIVQVYELGKEDEHFFISMEYVHGLDLGRLIRKVVQNERKVPIKFAIHIVSQILQGLDCAHRVTDAGKKPLGIVHRDISPPNLLCSWQGELKIADFGIAKGNHRTIETTMGQLKGKFSYMSPEQASGKAVDRRTDIYAAGIILFELLSGTRLYESSDDIKVVDKVRRSRIPLSRIKELSPEFKEICLTALSRDPENRYQTAGEFLTALKRCAVEQGHVAYGFEFGCYLRELFPEESDESEEDLCAMAAGDSNAETKMMTTDRPQRMAIWNFFHGPSFRRSLAASMLMLMSFVLPAGAAKKGEVPTGLSKRIESKTVLLTPPKNEGVNEIVKEVKPKPEPKIEAVEKENEDQKTLADVMAGAERKHKVTKVETKNTTKKVGSGRISVNANPWGYVTIPGYVSKRETPLRNLKVKSGKYLVKVTHPPTGKKLARHVTVSNDKSVRCFARFSPQASMSCR